MEVSIYKSNSLLDKKGIDNFTKKGFLREGGEGILFSYAPVIVYFWNRRIFPRVPVPEAYKLQALIGTSCFSYRVSRET